MPTPIGATHVAIDRCDRVYVVTTGVAAAVFAFDASGAALSSPLSPSDLAKAFSPAVITVDASGNLDLRAWCAPSKPSDRCACPPPEPPSGWFDANGDALAKVPAAPTKIYVAAGVYRTEALDSRTADCQWHRVVLGADLPAGTRIAVRTCTSEVPYGKDELDAFGTWRDAAVAQRAGDDADAGTWDCLVRSGPGRYLWLELAFAGDGIATPALRDVVIEFPRISLRRFLPAVFGAEPVSAEFTDRFLSLFDTGFRSIEREIDVEARLFDPSSAPAAPLSGRGVDFLTWLASWVGVVFDRHLRRGHAPSLPQGRRAPVRQARHARRVARAAPAPARVGRVQAALRARAASAVQVHTGARQLRARSRARRGARRRWCSSTSACGAGCGSARGDFGEQAVLWGSRIVNRTQLDGTAQAGVTKLVSTPDPDHDPFLVYAHQFSVFVPARCRDSTQMRKALDNLLRQEAPAHTRYSVHFVEPRFRIGVQSMLGFDAVVAALPQGVSLGVDAARPGLRAHRAAALGGRTGHRHRQGRTRRHHVGAELTGRAFEGDRHAVRPSPSRRRPRSAPRATTRRSRATRTGPAS